MKCRFCKIDSETPDTYCWNALNARESMQDQFDKIDLDRVLFDRGIYINKDNKNFPITKQKYK